MRERGGERDRQRGEWSDATARCFGLPSKGFWNGETGMHCEKLVFASCNCLGEVERMRRV